MTSKQKLGILLLLSSVNVTKIAVEASKGTPFYKQSLRNRLNSLEKDLQPLIKASGELDDESGALVDDIGIEFIGRIQDCLELLFNESDFNKQQEKLQSLFELLGAWSSDNLNIVERTDLKSNRLNKWK